MDPRWSSLILLAAECVFAVLFVRALLGYLRRRDPLQRDVTLIFAPCAVLFAVDLAGRLLDGPSPGWFGSLARVALLAQPYLTIRLAGRLRHVPGWLDRSVLATTVVIEI